MADILSGVKNALGITGTYQDDTLKVYVKEIQGHMVDAGVPEIIVNAAMSAGVIARGVTDIWNYNNGAGKLSDYFYQRVAQLVYFLQTGKVIYFYQGDYGSSYPVNIEGLEIAETDTVIFKCEGIEKEYTGVLNNCVLITLTKEESESLETGSYSWTLEIAKDNSKITAVKDGLLIVG